MLSTNFLRRHRTNRNRLAKHSNKILNTYKAAHILKRIVFDWL